jgi:hypothetical protein
MFEAGRALLLRAWMLWTSCSHKKAVIAGTCLMAWNLSSVSARLFGGKLEAQPGFLVMIPCAVL